MLEYQPGGDVELLIDREGALNPATTRFYAGCLALALEALHDLGIVHRDVKPDNLCIGSDGYARLVDLAYAKALPADGDSVVSRSAIAADARSVALATRGGMLRWWSVAGVTRGVGDEDATADEVAVLLLR